ncbi:TonB-dependent receptor [Bernardetia sp. Wsw4-3y2]|uniref:TonB-dependent receptor family protein n=1 Tax=Bernardetia sp. Wsw4-3y2 TaxID=3127471 RepID=UPI0030D1370A
MKFLNLQIAIKFLIAIFFTLVIFQNNVFGQTTKNQNDTDSLDKTLESVIISSNYLKSSEVIIPTTQLKQENFDRHSPKDLVNIMNQTAGVFIQQGAINTNRITIRGVGSRTLYGTNKIRAYFNGIPITNGVSETVINIFNPEDLESVEIVKGAKATQYGTNLGGTILLNSKTPKQGSSSIVNSLTLGSFGLMKNNIGGNYGGEKFSLHFDYDRFEQKGYRENSNFDRKNYFLLPTFYLSKKTEISLLFNYVDYFGQIPSSISKTDFEENPEKAAFTWKEAKGYEDQKQLFSAITLTHRFNSNFSNTTSVFYSKNENYEPRPFNILTENTDGLGTRTLFAISLPSFFDAEISTGTEIYYDNYDWKTYENLYQQNNGNGSLEGNNLSKNMEKRWNYSVFATTTLQLSEKLSSQFGLNLNHTYYDYQNELDNSDINRKFEPILAPNISFTYSFSPQKSIYTNVSRGFNYPSLEETLTPNGLVNPKITAEKGWNYEIGTDLFFLKNNNLHFNLSAYLLQINGLLVAKRINEDQYIGRNAGKTSHKGLELSSDYTLKLNQNWLFQTFANGTLNFHEFVDFVDEEKDFSGNQLTGVPEKQLYAGFSLKQNKSFAFHFIYQHVGKMPMNDANLLYSEAYNLLNLKVDYQISLLNTIFIKASVGVDNLLNKKYASAILINATGFGNSEPRFYYSGLPRNYFGNLRFEYRF